MGLSKRQLRRTTLLLAVCVAFLGGIGLAHRGRTVGLAWTLAVTCLALSLRRRRAWALVWALCFGLCLGWWRGSLYMHKLAAYQPLYGQKISLMVRAGDDAVYGKSSQLSFEANQLQLADSGQRLAGKLELSGFGVSAVYQGDTLLASGKLYPAFGAYQARMSFAKLQLVDRRPTVVAQLRRRFTAGMQSALPEPLAPFAMGLLIGQRATLPADTKQDLLMVGLTHIIAVSGYNLTIMLEASRRLLGRHSKRLSTWLSLGLMGVFLLLAGASASIVRAAIVSVLSITANYYGRTIRPLNLITLAAAITTWANPFYLWSDTSWYLSFLAFFGVMVLSPLLAARLPERWRDSLPVTVALESLCAETMTLPFVLYTFGQMSFIGLPANVLVVTLIPLAMLLSLIAGLAGMFVSPVAGWFAWPARLLLTYMLDIAHLLAHIPRIFAQNLGFSAVQMISMYGVIASLIVVLAKRQAGTRLNAANPE